MPPMPLASLHRRHWSLHHSSSSWRRSSNRRRPAPLSTWAAGQGRPGCRNTFAGLFMLLQRNALISASRLPSARGLPGLQRPLIADCEAAFCNQRVASRPADLARTQFMHLGYPRRTNPHPEQRRAASGVCFALHRRHSAGCLPCTQGAARRRHLHTQHIL